MRTPQHDTYSMPGWALPSMFFAGITGIAIGVAPHLIAMLTAGG